MKTCPKCSNVHQCKGVFCSRSCANSRKWTKSDKAKKSAAAKRFYESLTEHEVQNLRERISSGLRTTINARHYLFLMQSDFNDLAQQSKRARTIIEQDGKCNNCRIDSWLGHPICFELEHKDGNRENNSRENLEALCPNCHSLTPTWRGKKNKKNGTSTRQDFINRMVTEHTNNRE